MTERLAHTIAFRVTPTEYLELLPFFDCFAGDGGGGSSAGLRWLLSQEATKATIRDRVSTQRTGAPA